MPRPRVHTDNASRQSAYRERLREAEQVRRKDVREEERGRTEILRAAELLFAALELAAAGGDSGARRISSTGLPDALLDLAIPWIEPEQLGALLTMRGLVLPERLRHELEVPAD